MPYFAIVTLARLFEVQVVGGAPQGLRNKGATCFLNSILQALRSCKYFTEAVVFHSKEVPKVTIGVALDTFFVLLTQIPSSNV